MPIGRSFPGRGAGFPGRPTRHTVAAQMATPTPAMSTVFTASEQYYRPSLEFAHTYGDYILVTDPATNTTYTVQLRQVNPVPVGTITAVDSRELIGVSRRQVRLEDSNGRIRVQPLDS